MRIAGVDINKSKSNHILEIEQVLGIEASRNIIIQEISIVMKSHSISLDLRHICLLADIMTYKGKILGITRFGISKMKESTLMLASFEKTMDVLFEAAIHNVKD